MKTLFGVIIIPSAAFSIENWTDHRVHPHRSTGFHFKGPPRVRARCLFLPGRPLSTVVPFYVPYASLTIRHFL